MAKYVCGTCGSEAIEGQLHDCGPFVKKQKLHPSGSLNGSIAESLSVELKPCPFCGAEADHLDKPNDVDDGYVCCSNSECDAAGFDMAFAKWNMRV